MQYIQVGWSLNKTYGTFAPATTFIGYNKGGTLPMAIINWDFGGFSSRALGADFRGLIYGEYGANHFNNFKDFVAAQCPKECK